MARETTTRPLHPELLLGLLETLVREEVEGAVVEAADVRDEADLDRRAAASVVVRVVLDGLGRRRRRAGRLVAAAAAGEREQQRQQQRKQIGGRSYRE